MIQLKLGTVGRDFNKRRVLNGMGRAIREGDSNWNLALEKIGKGVEVVEEVDGQLINRDRAFFGLESPEISTKSRMAGDKGDRVEQLLAEYERELDMESDAIQYASNRRPDLDLLKADGQSYGDVEEQLLQLGQLRGNSDTAVPAPLVDTLANGNELRTHTRYGTNDVTGMQEVRPFIDTETGEALATEFGMRDLKPVTRGKYNGDPDYPDMTASEAVGLNAAKLMEEGNVIENDQYGTKYDRYGRPYEGKMSHYADLKVGDKKVDLMMVGRGGDFDSTMNIPRYTNILRKGDTKLKQRIQELQRSGLTLEQSVRRLANLKEIKPIGPNSAGKLARSNIKNVGNDPEAVYDELLVSGYDRKMLKDANDIAYGRRPYGREHPLAKQFATDAFAVAPETLHRVDLPGLRSAIDSGEIKTNVFTNANRGVNKQGHVRDKVQESIPQNNNPYITDVTVTHPYTQQILKNLPYV